MSNPTTQQNIALRIEAGSCFFIFLKKHDHSESLTAHYAEYLFFLRLMVLIHFIRRNAHTITMITDGRGNVIAGGNNGGKSHISYKPYGKIHRTDSSGPDITRFKYTGQEEDKESGLMYYKARYYDPMVGRFLQADSVVMPESTFGMNRYMYVEGNPVRYTDPSGHANVSHMFGQMVKHTIAGAAQFAKDIKGGAEWASGGLARAQDKFNHEKFQATGSKYERGPWARQHRRMFGEKQGSINNEFWDDLITRRTINFRTTIEAWSGSLMIMKGAEFSLQNLPAVFSFNYHQFDGLLWPGGKYVLGGTHNFSTNNWNEKAARRGGALGACYALDAYTAIVALGTAYPAPNGGTYTPIAHFEEVLTGMSDIQKFAGGVASLFNAAMGIYGAGNGKNCEGFAKQAFSL